MSLPLSLSSSPLPPPQPTLPSLLSSSPSLSAAAWRHRRRAWRRHHQAWRRRQALRCRVRVTSLVLLPRGVASSASVALLPSVELSPSLVLSPSISELGVVVTERVPSGVALSPRLASSPKRAVVGARGGQACAKFGVVVAERRGIVAQAWCRRHRCCH